MTEKTARTEDAAAAAEAAASADPVAQQQPDPVAVATELRDRLLRTLAVTSFARDILGVADNMRRALDAVSPEMRASVEAGVKALVDGVELTERELLKALEKNGVRQFTPHGEKFDPNVHQAMFEVPNPSVPAGSVVEVVAPGYMLGERVLRPAMVGVSKGGPKTAPASRPVNDNATAGATKDS
jgi:molecular chaperone GrpE